MAAVGVGEVQLMTLHTALRIVIDDTPLIGALSSLAEIANRSLEVRDRLLDLFESGDQLFRIESDDLSTCAGELLVRLYPSDLLASFPSA
jgi:hypothetical protein